MKKYLIPVLLIAGIFAAYWIAYGINPLKKIFGGSGTDSNADTPAPEETTGAADSTGKVSPNAQPSQSSFLKSPAPTKDSRGFPLSIGSTGEYVKMIQTALNDRFGCNLTLDGIFGQKTAKALSANGYNADAIYYKHFNEIVGYQYWK